jgi:23S rRNA (adenine2503-C2)-methyltransferase
MMLVHFLHQITNASPSQGQGEPLLNFNNVSNAIRLLSSTPINLHPRRTTLSTSGIAPLIPRVASEIGCKLALSLHATTDELRDVLVPINRRYPLKEVIKSVEGYLENMKTGTHFSHGNNLEEDDFDFDEEEEDDSDGSNVSAAKQRKAGSRPLSRVTLEYVMLANVNDSQQEAFRLISLFGHLPVHVNLIPFNPWPGSSYICSSSERILEFQRWIKEGKSGNGTGVKCTIRKTRGGDVLAACGQLRSNEELKRRALAKRAKV